MLQASRLMQSTGAVARKTVSRLASAKSAQKGKALTREGRSQESRPCRSLEWASRCGLVREREESTGRDSARLKAGAEASEILPTLGITSTTGISSARTIAQ
jgi:hypothetical protein